MTSGIAIQVIAMKGVIAIVVFATTLVCCKQALLQCKQYVTIQPCVVAIAMEDITMKS
jgi:hypothetical protein